MAAVPIQPVIPPGVGRRFRLRRPSLGKSALSRNEARWGLIFLSPWLIGFLGLTLGPALISLYLSFTDYDLLQSPNLVGADNYIRIATADPKFAGLAQR